MILIISDKVKYDDRKWNIEKRIWDGLNEIVLPNLSFQKPVNLVDSWACPWRVIKGCSFLMKRLIAILPIWTSTGAWSIILPDKSALSKLDLYGGEWKRNTVFSTGAFVKSSFKSSVIVEWRILSLLVSIVLKPFSGETAPISTYCETSYLSQSLSWNGVGGTKE